MSIIQAAKEGDLEEIRFLVQNGSNPNEVDENSKTALHWAAINGHQRLVLPLVQELKLNINAQDINGWTPLFASCVESKYDIASTLLRLNAATNIAGTVNGQEVAPILIAAEDANFGLLKEFADHKANLDAKLQNDSTAMHLIASRTEHPQKRLDILTKFIKYGAHASKDDLGYTPSDYLNVTDLYYGSALDEVISQQQKYESHIIGDA